MKWGVVLAYGLDVRYGSSNVHRSHTRDTTDDSGLFILDTYNPSTAASYREEELAPPSDTREMPPGGGFQPCLHCSFMDHGQVAACRFLNILGTLGNVRTLIYSFMEEDARCYRTRGGVIYCTILKRARRFNSSFFLHGATAASGSRNSEIFLFLRKSLVMGGGGEGGTKNPNQHNVGGVRIVCGCASFGRNGPM